MDNLGKITLKTIAEALNLSLTTVSRVLNGTSEKYRIANTTQEIVLQKSKELGYIPNMAAKTLRNSRSKTIGLLLPSLDNPFFSQIASTVTKTLYAKGYVVLISDCNNNPKDEVKYLKSLIGQNLEGLLIIPCGDKSNFSALSKLNMPIVFIDRMISGMKYLNVRTNHYKTTYKLMNYLYTRGHQKIACIQGDPQVSSNASRVAGYEKFIKDYNLAFSYIGGKEFTSENGYISTRELISSSATPTAIISFSDTILLGVLQALKENNWKVPTQVSVVSIDNSPYLDFLEVPITSIAQPIQTIAEHSSSAILDMINNKNSKYSSTPILLDADLVERKSVRTINE